MRCEQLHDNTAHNKMTQEWKLHGVE